MMLFAGTALYASGQTAVASCADLNDDDKPETALAYLNQDFQLLDSCIQEAVHIIKKNRYQSAISTLIKLIDFRKP